MQECGWVVRKSRSKVANPRVGSIGSGKELWSAGRWRSKGTSVRFMLWAHQLRFAMLASSWLPLPLGILVWSALHLLLVLSVTLLFILVVALLVYVDICLHFFVLLFCLFLVLFVILLLC